MLHYGNSIESITTSIENYRICVNVGSSGWKVKQIPPTAIIRIINFPTATSIEIELYAFSNWILLCWASFEHGFKYVMLNKSFDTSNNIALWNERAEEYLLLSHLLFIRYKWFWNVLSSFTVYTFNVRSWKTRVTFGLWLYLFHVVRK